MKTHLLLLTVALSCGLYSFAQVSFGIKAGFSGANINSKYIPPNTEGVKVDTKMLPAFHAGVIVDFALADYCSFQPGLFYSVKGYKVGTYDSAPSDEPVPATITTRLNYLEMPLNFIYKQSFGRGKFFGGIGPYLAYGINGKLTQKNDRTGEEISMHVRFENGSNLSGSGVRVRPLDAGANLVLGFELNMGLLLSVNYSLGLVNTSPYEYEKIKNRYFGISAGYLLKR